MPGEGRRPAVVMFTDMVGYSDLTQRDEMGALQLLGEHRRIVRPLLQKFGGREVKTIGDAFMVEFGDGTAAVRCALEIQRQHAERNRNLELTEINIRIGLHAGEVIQMEGDLYGDTVNIASRIEPLASPGGICLSQPVFEAAREGIDVTPAPIGPATLKNIHLPIPVYRIDLRPERHIPTREGPWVDREAELSRLEEAVAAAAEGPGAVVLVSGEGGVGKSRLAEQAVRLASRRGMRAVRGRASEEGANAPYALWVEAIQGLLNELSRADLERAAGEYGHEIALLLPASAAATPADEPVRDGDADLARDRLFRGVIHLFAELARERPIVLLLDDLQWADSASLRLFAAFAAGVTGSHVLVLACHRPDPGAASGVLAEVTTAVSRVSGATSLELDRLALDPVRKLVLALVKTKAVPDRFVLQLYEKTRGNPFFVEEVIRALREQGLLGADPDRPFDRIPETLPLPDTVRRLVRRRVERIDPAVADFLRTVAVLGPAFPLAPLSRLTGLASDPLIDRLGQTVGLGLLTETSDERGEVRYFFTHRETWETIYGDTPIAFRVRHHLKAAEALEHLAQAGTRIPAAELAHHYLEGRELGKAVEYSLRAAEEAARLFAREEAVRHYRVCLELLEQRPDERLRVRLLDALSEQLYRLGQLEASQSMRRDAAERYERLGELRAAGNLHRRIAHAMREDTGTARHHWEEALRLIGDGPETPELARLYNTIAGFRYEAGEAGPSRELYSRAVDIARRVGDPPTEVAAQMVLSGLRPMREAARVVSDLVEALAVARAQGLSDLVPNLLMVLALAHLHIAGDAPAAEQALREAIAEARRSRDVYSEQAIEGNLATYVAWRLGQYARAMQGVEAHTLFAAGDPRKLLPVPFLVGGDIELTRGRPERAVQFLDEADAILAGGGDWSERVQLANLRGRIDLDRRRLPRARATLREAHELATRMGVPALMAVLHAETLHLEVEAELVTGPSPAAERALTELDALVAIGSVSPVHGIALRARGLMREAAGDLSGSAEAYLGAIADWERFGWTGELARTRLLLAGIYRRGGEGERAEPLEAAAHAYRESTLGVARPVSRDPGRGTE